MRLKYNHRMRDNRVTKYIKYHAKTGFKKGVGHSYEHRKKLSENHRDCSGKNNPFYGKKHSPEILLINKLSHIGKRHTNETKRKIGKSSKGRRHRPESIEKIKKYMIDNKINVGRIHSEKFKEKLRIARLHQVFPKKDTKPERKLQSILSVNGIKYEKHKSILGQPDIFIEPNICIFVDGCYWHGCLKCNENNIKYKQVENNIIRDSIVTEKLQTQNYQVLRFWQHEIENDPLKVLEKISLYY